MAVGSIYGSLAVMNDSRLNCISIMTQISIRNYMDLVKNAYADRGGISGQRDALKTTAAIRIRNRMVQDIQQGAVLPPIVLGLVLNHEDFKKITAKTISQVHRKSILAADHEEKLSIIDGMQRTTAIFEAFDGKTPPPDRELRIEFWVAEDVGSLIYRMLVLNTGQVPWNLRRQVEVVYRSLILDLKKSVPGLHVKKEKERRTNGGDFQGNELVELYLVFGSRKETVDVKERLADEFTRLDFMEVAERDSFSAHFRKTLSCLVKLDKVLDRKSVDAGVEGRFTLGRDIFASQPACVGFITAIAIKIFGRPGVNRGEEDQLKSLLLIISRVEKICARIENMPDDDYARFLSLEILNDSLPKSRAHSSIGNSEREYFLKAFQVLIEEQSELETLEPCWRAY